MVYISEGYKNWAGPIAMLVGVIVSIWLFSNQTKYVGIVPTHVPGVGDLTFEIGFLLAFGIYATLYKSLAQPIAVGEAGTSFTKAR
jgi:cytosine/uracil/thiamine/allantoin permease